MSRLPIHNMGQFVRRTTHRVILLQRDPGKTARAGNPRQAPSRTSASMGNRVDASTQTMELPRGSASKNGLSDIQSDDREIDSRGQATLFRRSKLLRNPKRVLSLIDSNTHEEPLPKRQQCEMGQHAKQTEVEVKTYDDDRTGITAVQQLLQHRGRWLFNKDRQNLAALSETDRQTQSSLAQFQKDLMQTRPGEYMFLCIMSLPREIRDMVFAAKFAHLPNVLVMRTRRYRDISSLPSKISFLPPICYVSRQFFEEAVPVLLRGRKITLGRSGICLFASILTDCKGKCGFTAVTNLTFERNARWTSYIRIVEDDDYESNENNGMQLDHSRAYGDMLVACCPALNTLTIEVYCDDLSKKNRIRMVGSEYSDSEDESRTLKTVEELRGLLPLGALRRCKAFNLLRVVVLSGYKSTPEQEHLQPLTDYLKKRLPMVAPQATFEISLAKNTWPRSFIGFQDEV